MNSSEPVGTIRALWRFPVKSMRGEELDAADLGEGGIVGDRAFAIRDRETGKVASAKHPKLWPNLLACRAAFVEPPRPGDELPPARIELADGNSVMSDATDADAALSRFFGREVELAHAAQNGYTIDQYHPDEENYDPEGHRDEVVEAQLGAAFFNERGLPSAVPEGSFFDLFPLSVLTTSTLDQLSELEPESRFDARRFRMNVIVDTSPRWLRRERVGRSHARDRRRREGRRVLARSSLRHAEPCAGGPPEGRSGPQGARPAQPDRRRGCALPLRRRLCRRGVDRDDPQGRSHQPGLSSATSAGSEGWPHPHVSGPGNRVLPRHRTTRAREFLCAREAGVQPQTAAFHAKRYCFSSKGVSG